MPEFIEKIGNQLVEFFKTLDTTKKVAFFAIMILVISVSVGVVGWATKTRFKVMFTNLNQEDTSSIGRMLEEKGIAYQISEDSKTISVPEDQVEVLRLEMAKQGVALTGTVGYEVFDEMPLGTTSFVQKVNKKRAIEGELIKTIKYIKGVKRCRVHISMPESSPFIAEKKLPSASVVLELDYGVDLTDEEIRGIASLVASSVELLRPENVVILDSRGKKLSENIGDPLTLETSNKISLESKISMRYETKIEEILGKVVGAGKVAAKVTVDLDFTESVSTQTSYDGENSAVISEVVNSQTLQGSRPSPQGLPGARSNLPGEDPRPGFPETKNNVDKKIATRNYNVPTTVTQAKSPTAKIKNISVAVMLDGKYSPEKNNKGEVVFLPTGSPKLKYQPWTNAELENFREIVASTLGINTSRGDKLVIRNMEFAKEDMIVAETILKNLEKKEVLKNMVKYISVGLLILCFFVLVVRPFIQWITENTIESVEDYLPQTIEELEKLQADQKLPGLEDALPQIEERINPEKIEGNMLREKIISLVEQNPAKAAQVIQSMIHSQESQKEIA